MSRDTDYGRDFERDVAAFLRDHGFPDAQRIPRGFAGVDPGDIRGAPGWLVECKARRNVRHWRVPTWWREVCEEVEAHNEARRIPPHWSMPADAVAPVLIVKRPRKPVGASLTLSPVDEALLVPRDPGSWLRRNVPGHGARLAAVIDDGPVLTDLGLVACTLADWCREVGS